MANNRCPSCDYPLDAATAPSDETIQPKPGDLSVCIACGAFATFTQDLNLQTFPDEKILDLPDEMRMELVRARKMVLTTSTRK